MVVDSIANNEAKVACVAFASLLLVVIIDVFSGAGTVIIYFFKL